MMKKRLFVLVLALILVMSGCGSSDKNESATMDMASSTSTEAVRGGESFGSSSEMEFNYVEEEALELQLEEQTAPTDDGAYEGGGGTVITDGNIPSTRKIIKTGYVYMEALDYEKTLEEIKGLIEQFGAYTSYSESSGGSIYERGYNSRYARFTIKVPAQMFEGMFEALHTAGHVLNSNEGKQDVTSQFVDIEARLKTLEVQEERLLSILEKTENLEDVIELEYALQDTRYEIERYTTNLRNLQDLVSFSTIELTVQEVWEETKVEEPAVTFTDRISEGLKETFEEISEGFQSLIVFLVTQFPYILFMMAVGFGIFKFYRRLARKDQLLAAKVKSEDKEKDAK